MHTAAPDLKAGTKIILESVESMNDKWRLGHTKVFFRAGGENGKPYRSLIHKQILCMWQKKSK